MRVLVVTWDGAGNLVSTLGHQPGARARSGHDVRLLGHRSIDERCGNDGWRFRPFVHTADYDSTRPARPRRRDGADVGAALVQRRRRSRRARRARSRTGRRAPRRRHADRRAVCRRSQRRPDGRVFHAAFSIFRAGPLVEMLAPALPAVAAIRDDLGLPPVASIVGRARSLRARISSRRRVSSNPTCRCPRTSRSSARCSTARPAAQTRRCRHRRWA